MIRLPVFLGLDDFLDGNFESLTGSDYLVSGFCHPRPTT